MTDFINGGFEDGDFTGWTSYGAGNVVNIASKYSGTYGCQIECGPGEWVSIRQTIPALDPTKKVSFRYKINSSDGGNYGILLSMGGGDDHQLSPSSGTSGWMLYEGYPSDWDIPETMDTEIVLALADGAYNTHIMYVDDFDIGHIDPSPISLIGKNDIESRSTGIVNGDFETGNLTGWNIVGTTAMVDTTSPHSGSYAYHMVSGQSCGIQQNISGTAGDIFSFWLKIPGWTSNLVILNTKLYYEEALVKDFCSEFGYSKPNPGYSDYHQYVHELQDTGSYSFYINFYCDPDVPVSIYMDDVEFITPSPINLIGIMDIKQATPIDLIGISDIIGAGHTVPLVGISGCSHGVPTQFRCVIR